MRQIVLLILFALPGFVFCQENRPLPKKRISEGLIFVPEYAFRSMKLTGEINPDIQKSFDLENSLEIPRFGFTAGFGFQYDLCKWFGLETGILFSVKGEKTKSLAGLLQDPYGWPYSDLRYSYAFQYFCLPVKAWFNLITKPVRIFVSAGISVNMLIAAKCRTFYTYHDGTSNSEVENITSHFDLFNYQLLCSAGVEYTLREKIRFRFEPIFSRSINPINEGKVKQYLWSVGPCIGVYYTF